MFFFCTDGVVFEKWPPLLVETIGIDQGLQKGWLWARSVFCLFSFFFNKVLLGNNHAYLLSFHLGLPSPCNSTVEYLQQSPYILQTLTFGSLTFIEKFACPCCRHYCPIQFSTMMKMFHLCGLHNSRHWSHLAIEVLKCNKYSWKTKDFILKDASGQFQL